MPELIIGLVHAFHHPRPKAPEPYPMTAQQSQISQGLSASLGKDLAPNTGTPGQSIFDSIQAPTPPTVGLGGENITGASNLGNNLLAPPGSFLARIAAAQAQANQFRSGFNPQQQPNFSITQPQQTPFKLQ